MSPASSVPSIRVLDSHVVAVMRLVLASWAMLAILIDVVERRRSDVPVSPEYIVLCLYTLYSALLYLSTRRPRASAESPLERWAHWVDVGWYALLVLVGGGANSIFFLGFLFPILVASFRWGFAAGLRVAIVSAIVFSLIGFASALQGTLVELGLFLLRPIYLLVLGYMMAYWGGFELELKRRLSLLKEVSTLSNPRFGVDQTICSLIERLRQFYEADNCLLIMKDEATQKHLLFRTSQGGGATAACGEPIEEGLADVLQLLPQGYAAIYNGRDQFWSFQHTGRRYAYDTATGDEVPLSEDMVSRTAATLDAGSFVSVPFSGGGSGPLGKNSRSREAGRLYLTGRERIFESSDLQFLTQVVENIIPVIQNIRLVDRLASDAAEEERMRIARDLHDSVIQPYIGLQMAIAAFQRKFSDGDEKYAADVQRLEQLTADAITDLRRYVRGLRNPGSHEGSLLPAIRRFTARFSQATNIAVDVETSGDLDVSDRLSAQVFQMVAEGLSNIRRHTTAEHATINVARRDGHLILRVENDCAEGSQPVDFTPRSISERASTLGGSARVEQTPAGATAVVISIPL